jgi:hypothetical protein
MDKSVQILFTLKEPSNNIEPILGLFSTLNNNFLPMTKSNSGGEYPAFCD